MRENSDSLSLFCVSVNVRGFLKDAPHLEYLATIHAISALLQR